MKDVLDYLDERKDEFERHLTVARMLEKRVTDAIVDDGMHVEIRHINTIKSGLLIHLYNIVEAVSTRTLEVVGEVVAGEIPGTWTEEVLKEWVRAEIWSSDERIGEPVVKRLTEISGALASGNKLNQFVVKGEPGSWDDKSISKVASRLGCSLNIPDDVRRGGLEPKYRNETSALRYLALRRNDIAHGKTTFEEGANDLTLQGVDELSNRVLPYLRAVTASYQTFLDNKDFLKKVENAA